MHFSSAQSSRSCSPSDLSRVFSVLQLSCHDFQCKDRVCDYDYFNAEFPTVTLPEKSYTERENVPLVVTPTINLGRPQGRVEWTFQDASLQPALLGATVSSTNSLIIDSVNKNHRGIYTVKVIGGHTNVSANFSLNVYCKFVCVYVCVSSCVWHFICKFSTYRLLRWGREVIRKRLELIAVFF